MNNSRQTARQRLRNLSKGANMEEVKKIYLHGALGKQFGDCFELAVNTPLEAVRALCLMVKEFQTEFEKYDYKVVKGSLQRGWYLNEETLQMNLTNEVHFIPVIAGSGGKKGLGQLITGIFIVGLAFTGVGAGLAGFLGTTVGKLKLIGAILAIGGLAKMNAKTPQFSMSSMEPADRRPSFVFQGATNTTEQGNVIPLIYGRIRCGSQVVAQGMDTVNI
jgi:predicted phage tail protein